MVVTAGIDEAWAFVSDLPSVLTCMPGAELREPLGDAKYQARIVISAGDFRVSFNGVIGLEASDPWTAVIRASGGDRMRTISSEAQATIRLRPGDAHESQIDISATFDFSGYLAGAARAGSPPVARALLDRFAACLTRQLSSPSTA